ncbi:hypothetical protein Thiosp_00814 [Thiorhodovibrio litoralis]|nr:hypothetical protein Thiosp_00814 [Thiorhodovibrio litoralis]
MGCLLALGALATVTGAAGAADGAGASANLSANLSDSTSASSLSDVPPMLAPWVPWVLRDADWRDCPLAPMGTSPARALSSQVAEQEKGRLCLWPGALTLNANEAGGRFAQTWRLYAPRWVPLPGDAKTWPQQVEVDGDFQPVLDQQGRPAVFLQAGEHDVEGRFVWSRLPDGLQLPEIRARVNLRLGNKDIQAPRIDADGRLWLGTGPVKGQGPDAAEAGRGDTLALDVTRLLADGVPVRLTTRLELEVSGQPRELRLTGAVPPEALALQIDSPLPSHLDDQGQLRLQVQPGRWVVQVQAQYPGRPTRFALAGIEAPWPTREVWAFRADPELRQVEVQGAPAVDPRQTRLPPDWQSLPAYGMQAGDTLVLEPMSAAQAGRARLRLERDLWLDFSGRGYSLRDRIDGELAGLTRLDARSPLHLGQVRVDDQPRLITRLPAPNQPNSDQSHSDQPDSDQSNSSGVEVRGELLSLLADGRLDALRAKLPASGWAVPFERISTRLYLPPGWDLLAVTGADNLPGSWLARWSLLDLFLVLVAALACARLWGWRWGVLALLTLVLIWQEPDAPLAVWLHLIAAAALLRLLPATRAPDDTQPRALQRARVLVQLYFRAALLVLVLIAIPFLVQQMRDGLYPQLNISPTTAFSAVSRNQAPASLMDEADGMVQAELARSAPAPEPYANRSGGVSSMAKSKAPDWNAPPPGAVLQTGAGVPDWRWNAFDLQWNGPVASDHSIRLWLVPPIAALVLAVASLLLVPALALRIADLWPPARGLGRGPGHPGASGAGKVAGNGADNDAGKGAIIAPALALMLPLLAAPWLLPQPAQAAEAPNVSTATGAPRPASASIAAAPAPGVSVDTSAFPPSGLLDALREHLLEAPECWPDCVTLTRLHLEVGDDQLRLLLTVSAGTDASLALPGGDSTWSPQEVSIDGAELPLARRTQDGHLLVPVTDGRHQLELVGPLDGAVRVELPLPLMPRLVTTDLDPAWQLEGLRADGQAGSQLRLVRVATSSGAQQARQAQQEPETALTPLLRLERDLNLGLTWELRSRVRRLSPADTSVSLWLPLLPGEAVTSAETQVVEGRLLLSLAPGQRELAWSSRLAPSQQLELQASVDSRLVETWCIGVSPFWHLQTEGIAPVGRDCGDAGRSAAGRATPARLWRPWPGEHLGLDLVRPGAVPGPTLTLDQTRYELTPGRRASEASLNLKIRSSQGGQHEIRLPEGAERLEVRIDGDVRGLALKDGRVDLPLVPGVQQVALAWQQPGGMALSYQPAPVDVGAASVNASTEVKLGADRWVLWVQGAGVGPAVLFWSLLAVLVVLAWGLGRLRLTPLGWVDWLLLGIGLSQADLWVGLLVAGWLLVLGWRRRLDGEHLQAMPAWRFDLAQIALVVWTLLALMGLLAAIQQGLLGPPRMQIAGNGSDAGLLRWYLDRSGPQLGEVLVLSVPMLVYRLLMLAWALWLALRLLAWLRWGWQSFSQPLLWRALPSRSKNKAATPSGRPGEPGTGADASLSLDI